MFFTISALDSGYYVFAVVHPGFSKGGGKEQVRSAGSESNAEIANIKQQRGQLT